MGIRSAAIAAGPSDCRTLGLSKNVAVQLFYEGLSMDACKHTTLSASLRCANAGDEHYSPTPVVQLLFNFPPVVGYQGLAQLMGRSVQSLQADRCRNPESVPPASTPPGCRTPLWVVTDVIAYIQQHKARGGARKAHKRVPGRGASTKAERLAATQAGLSVREWRAAQAKKEGGHD